MKLSLKPADGWTAPLVQSESLGGTAWFMACSSPPQENIRLKFKVSYGIDDNNISDVGEVDNFPVQ